MAHRIQKALVTGGAGFIGSHIAETLSGQGVETVVMDDLSSGKMANLDGFKDRITFVKGDIRDMETVKAAAAGCDLVFHEAAFVSVPASVQDPVLSAGINEIGTLTVLEGARNVGVKRVVLAASSAVYGDPETVPITEEARKRPTSPYAVQKLTLEFYADLYNELYGMETVCLRYFNVYGPRQDPSSPYSGVISIFSAKAGAKERPLIYGDGNQFRDFIFVSDVVRANLVAAGHEDAPGHTFNIGTGRRTSVNELWERIATISGAAGIEPEYEPAREGDIYASLAEVQKAESILGFKAKISLDEGLKRTLAWYQGLA